jgi:hypothetical protein
MNQFTEDELGLMLYSLIRLQQLTTACGSRQWLEYNDLIEKVNTQILEIQQ